MNIRFIVALACYTALALLSAATLDGVFRIGVLVVLSGLAVKTWIAQSRQQD
jgi:hypothetical protein